MDTWTRWAPTSSQASATQRTARPLIAAARSGSDSQASTAVHAAQWITTSGCHDVTAAMTARAIGDVEVVVGEAEDVVTRALGGGDDIVAELTTGPGDEQPRH